MSALVMVLVVSVVAGRERLADMMRAVDQPTRGEAGDCFMKIGQVDDHYLARVLH